MTKRFTQAVVLAVALAVATVPLHATWCGYVQVALAYEELMLFECRNMPPGQGQEDCFDAVYSVINALLQELQTCDPILQ